MDVRDAVKLQVYLRLAEMNLLLEGYGETLSYIGCEEAADDFEKSQESLEAAMRKLRINELLSEGKA